MEENFRNVECSYFIKFTWKIPNFSIIDTDPLYSDVFTGGDNIWRIVIFPKGGRKHNYLSTYLNVANSMALPSGLWNRPVKFRISVISEIDKHTVKRETGQNFNGNSSTWGFPLIALDKLFDPLRGYLVRDTCTVRAEVLFNEEDGQETADLGNRLPSFADMDTMFTKKNRKEENNMSRIFTNREFSEAKEIFKNCLNMDVTSFVQSGKSLELKKALSFLLTVKAFPNSMVDETSKFVADFDQHCKKYVVAQRFLSEAEEDKDSIHKVKTTRKQLSSELTKFKKKEADEMIRKFNVSWESLKGLRSSINW